MSTDGQIPPQASGRGIANAGFWSVGGKLASRLFDLATLVILTAILEPADFGLVAKAMTVVLIVEMITLIPVETPILRVKDPPQSLYDTAFTINVLRACLIGVMLVGLSWPLALYFKDPRLESLMWCLALAPALRGCTSPKLAEFTRRYDMRPEAAMDIASKLISMLLVTLVAMMTGSYWAIVVGTVTTSLVLNVLSYVFAPFRPALTLRHWHEFRDIVTWVTLSQTLQAVNWQLDNVILGRFLGNDLFGRYAIAKQLTDIPFQALAVPVSRPMVAAFSAAGDPGELRRLWLIYSSGMLFSVGPIMVALSILSGDVVYVLLGPGWEGADLYLSLLLLSTLPTLPLIPLNPLAVATFNARLVARRIFVQFLVSIPAMILGAYSAGILGVIAARATIEISMFVYISAVVRDQLSIPLARQFATHWRSLVGFAFLAVFLWLVRDLGAPLTDGSRVLTALRLFVLSLPCLIGYVVVCLVLWLMAGRPDAAESFLFRIVPKKLRGRA